MMALLTHNLANHTRALCVAPDAGHSRTGGINQATTYFRLEGTNDAWAYPDRLLVVRGKFQTLI